MRSKYIERREIYVILDDKNTIEKIFINFEVLEKWVSRRSKDFFDNHRLEFLSFEKIEGLFL